MPVHIGTSGWQYRHWRGLFYPTDVPQRLWLEHYAERFATVEVNNAFYRLPEAGTFASWAERTPDDFVVAVKASRYLTHVKRLRDPAEPVGRLLERAAHLGRALGPLLLQLPPTLHADVVLLDEVLAAVAEASTRLAPTVPAVRVAVEPRHPSWYADAVADVLSRRGAAFCLTDTPARRSPVWRTASWGYVRFHEGRASPSPCYGRRALATWAECLASCFGRGDDVYAYFNNDTSGCAVRDARRFAAAVAKAGLEPTRVPGPRETPVAD